MEELGVLLNALGMDLTESEIMDMMLEVDINGSGAIDFKEFSTMMGKYSVSREEEMASTWEALDVDGDGYITADELTTVLAKVGIRLAPWEKREMMAEVAPLPLTSLHPCSSPHLAPHLASPLPLAAPLP